MAHLDMDPMKRISIVIFHLESMLKDARDAAVEGDTEKLYQRLSVAFEMIDPLMRSLGIFNNSQQMSLIDKLLGMGR